MNEHKNEEQSFIIMLLIIILILAIISALTYIGLLFEGWVLTIIVEKVAHTTICIRDAVWITIWFNLFINLLITKPLTALGKKLAPYSEKLKEQFNDDK